MTGKCINLCVVAIVLLLSACSHGKEQLLQGKWVLASEIAGNSPTSYWFQENGNVVAPWEERISHLRSTGTYEFISEKHIKIMMNDGPYRGITFFFEIVKLDREELVLRGSIQDIYMKRAA
ncbi:MAG: hypothetical protein JSU90_00220 [Nitrospiraceae bacterium]|nr:MAG: hypothetical protein JSU90_00220 [Nitrospiraceae bacterium]